MQRSRLILTSLRHYWRTTLAVLVGVMVATAVISGALIVGDSVRASLRKMSLDRLGDVDLVLKSDRFFREDLADELQESSDFTKRFDAIAPVLKMTGGFERTLDDEVTRRIGKVNTYGVDERLWNLLEHEDVALPQDDQVVLNARTARDLGAAPGDEVTLWIEVPSSVPRDTLLGERDETATEIVLTVSDVLDEETDAGRLDLNPNQQLPVVAFVSLKTLQNGIGLAKQRPSRRNRAGSPARVNALFVSAKTEADGAGATAPVAAEALTELLSDVVTLDDLSLRLVENKKHGYISLESEQMILEDTLSDRAGDAAKKLGMPTSSVFVYLANRLSNAADADAFSMYSIVAGIDSLSAQPPFGPMTFTDPPAAEQAFSVGENPIVLNAWLAEDLKASVGDKITLAYHEVGAHGELPEIEQSFTVSGIVELDDTPAADPGLTPTVKGVTDAKTLRDWEQPFEMDLDAVTDRDDAYWDLHRATPKAFLPLEDAQELWKNRYGGLTSLRIAPTKGELLETSRETFQRAYLASLDLTEVGLAFQPVKFQGLKAASGTTPFAGLFVGFSFFLIVSATLLISILFRLGIEQRARDIGLLSAVGFSQRQVNRLFLAEASWLVVIGGILGSVLGVAYAALMVHGLKTWWFDAIGTRFLFVEVTPLSLATGFAISVAMGVVVVWWALRSLRNLSTRELLSGTTEEQSIVLDAKRVRRAARVAQISGAIGGVLALAGIAGVLPEIEAFGGFSVKTASFFVVGIATLVASIALLAVWLDSDKTAAVRGRGLAGTATLGLRNAARNRRRSVLSVALIASASFVIIAVAAGHRNPAVETPDFNSGNGGFRYVAESSTPLLPDLNTAKGRDELDLRVESGSDDEALLDKTLVMPFRVNPGENASCLNIYKTSLPTILGVTPKMIERGGFKFADTRAEHPWKLLTQTSDDGTIPVLGDLNTLQYSLHKGIGKTIGVPNDDAPEHTLKVAGMFDSSVFQGVLLMSEENFQKLFPDRAGFQYFLIGDRDADQPLSPEEAKRTVDVLETGLSPFGFDSERVVDRIASFLAVQNTYLSTFQTLGGLGLLLGTIGLSTVMLRNVLERRSELALLRAVGFRRGNVSLLVLIENAALLLWGLVAGGGSALLAMLPHLTTVGADVPWQLCGGILAAVFAVGMLASVAAVAEAVRTPIVATLRGE